jgi:hypothetical protein
MATEARHRVRSGREIAGRRREILMPYCFFSDPIISAKKPRGHPMEKFECVEGQDGHVSPREQWVAPKLVPLEKLANAEKLSYNTEGGFASGLS